VVEEQMERWSGPAEDAAERRNQQSPWNRGAWWVRVTSYGFGQPQRTIEERERVRRSQLASWILLAFLIVDVLLIPIGLSDPGTLAAIAVVFIGLLGGIVVNRSGRVEFVGWLVVALVDIGVMASLLVSGTGLTVDSLPAYDLMIASVVIAASILGPTAAIAVSTINIILICGDFFLQPHAHDLVADLATYPGIFDGALALLGRPVGLHIIITVVAILWVVGTNRAIRRADRAEEIAQLEHAVAEQRRQLEVGVAQLLQTHVRLANGDFSARAPTLQRDNMLWQVAVSLNNLIGRMQRLATADIHLQRASEESQLLLAALRDARAGRQARWPEPSGTFVDPLVQFFQVAASGGHELHVGASPDQMPAPESNTPSSWGYTNQPPDPETEWPPLQPPSDRR
jgi:hypothetical protein